MLSIEGASDVVLGEESPAPRPHRALVVSRAGDLGCRDATRLARSTQAIGIGVANPPLARAVQAARRMRDEGAAAVDEMNAESLRWRGKAGPKRKR